MEKQIEKLLEDIAADYKAWQGVGGRQRGEIQFRMYDEFVLSLRVEHGRKYIKIIQGDGVWGFINKCNKKFREGDILKAAGWNAPALNKPRGNVLDGNYEINWTGPKYL
jgi:hypothetical protein